MQEPNVAITAITEWLKDKFNDSEINYSESDDRETHVFRIRPRSGHTSELEVSQEVIDHNPIDHLIRDLEQSDTVDRMKRDPTMRIQYFSGGINHLEARYISCDGRIYLIVRDEGHNVSIFDASDARLQNSPQSMRVLPSSIFHVQASKWREQIRSWRGDEQ